MLNEFLTHINEKKSNDGKQLIKPTDKILLAVSGGKDSVVLLDLFAKASAFDFGVAHCNFQLRGEASDLDEEFVKKLAQNYQVKFHTVRFDTKKFAQENHLSTQLAARQLRYDWFEQVRQEFGYDFIATAHHFNDVIETVLLNLTKGTGIAGLHGIADRNGYVIRPFLFATREKIDEYIAENSIEWREDSSNASSDYQRNLLRNEVIPLLKKINPNLEETFRRNVEKFVSMEKIVRQEVEKLTPDFLEDETVLLKINNIKTCKSSDYVLEEFLKNYNFNAFQAKDIYKSLDGQSGKIFHSSTHTLIKDRENLIIERIDKSSPSAEIQIPEMENDSMSVNFGEINLTFNKKKRNNSALRNLKSEIQIDYDKLTFPLTLRRWRQGDWFVPLGMKGKKKISDFLIDKKVPISLKKKVVVLMSNDQIVWVIGHRLDDRFKVTPETGNVLEIIVK